MRHCLLALIILTASAVCLSQSNPDLAGPEEDGHEVQLWTGGGHSVSGGRGDTGVFNAGLRYGWIITAPHLPSFLRGRFEYTVDAVPMFLVFQPANTAYGLGFNPLGLKWDFVRRGRLSPYLELSGGTLFTNHNVPTYTNTVNFTSAAALGTHILGPKYNWSVELRYLHISNAGLAVPNPGINTVQVRLGVGRFFNHHAINRTSADTSSAKFKMSPDRRIAFVQTCVLSGKCPAITVESAPLRLRTHPELPLASPPAILLPYVHAGRMRPKFFRRPRQIES